MISHGFTIVSSFIFLITANSDDVIYTKPNLTSTENETFMFTEFHLINSKKVLHVTENVPFNNFFPKCCPPNYNYEKVDRRCVRSNDTWQFETKNFDDFYLIKSGLKDCEVIVDYVLQKDDFISISESYKSIQYKNETFNSGQFCIDDIENEPEMEQQLILRVCYGPEYCRSAGIRCLKKCCPDGEVFLEGICCPQPELGFPTEIYYDVIANFTGVYQFRENTEREFYNFAIFSQNIKYPVHKTNLTNETGRILENGSFGFTEGGPWKTYDVDEEIYCLEFLFDNYEVVIMTNTFMRTNFADTNYVENVINNVGIPLGCACFIATMVVYAFFYKLKKLIHRIVFCYCISQSTGFASMGLFNYMLDDSELYRPVYSVLVCIALFGFHAGLSWLTVICYDVWRTLGSMSTKVGNNNKLELKRTFYYSMYGWLVPTFITLTCCLETKYSFLRKILHVNMEESTYLIIVFYITPITCANIANIIFFVLTVRYVIEATENVRKMNETNKEKKIWCVLKERAFIVLKFFFAMGINWSFEIISATCGCFTDNTITNHIRLFLDIFNCFQGVFILLIFVLKWKVIKSSIPKLKTIVVGSASRSTSLASSLNRNMES